MVFGYDRDNAGTGYFSRLYRPSLSANRTPTTDDFLVLDRIDVCHSSDRKSLDRDIFIRVLEFLGI